MNGAVTIRRLDGFDDPRLGRSGWNALLARGDSNVVFLTWEWQRAWWDASNRSGLLLLLAERDGQPIALAPLFAEEGWIYFVGSGGSDYLDFIGDIAGEGVLDSLLEFAQRSVPDFRGLILYHILESSRTGPRLRAAAARLGLIPGEEQGMPAPVLDLQVEAAQTAPQKKSLVRHEKFFRRDGDLDVLHLRSAEEIASRLDPFFAQHIERWSGTESPSLFHEEAQRRFYRALTAQGAAAGWLRFTEVRWHGEPIAFHFGASHDGTYLWYKPSFDLKLARHSPGEVLLRQLLLAALAEGARRFDFGLGDEAFKRRFATETSRVYNWTLTS